MQNKLVTNALYAFGVMALMGAIFLATHGAGAQTVAAGDTVSVYYKGTLTNGTQFDSNFGSQPLKFVVGSGQVIPGFDNAVMGMKVNETKNVTISASDAYGPVNPALVVNAPIAAFGNMSVHVGMVVTATFGGGTQRGVVTAMNATNATVDFNNPLAGQTLIFEIEVVSIQKKG